MAMPDDETKPCGCRIWSGIDPLDGLETARLAPCSLGPACPEVEKFVQTCHAMADPGERVETSVFSIDQREIVPLVKPAKGSH